MSGLTKIQGLPVLFAPQSDRGAVGIALHVRAGSRFESPAERGAAHFLEHLVLLGSRRYPGDRAVAVLERDPRAFFAGTNREFCLFEASVPARRAAAAVRALLDSVFSPRLRDVHVESERAVVLDELNWRANDAPRALLATLFATIAGGSAAAGAQPEKEIVAGLGADLLRAYHRRCFLPERSVLAVAGGFVPRAIEEAIIGTVPGGRAGPTSVPETADAVPPPWVFSPRDHERTWLLVAHLSTRLDWRGHVAGRAVAQQANATGRGTVARVLRDSSLHLYSWECSYHALGPLGLMAVFIEAPEDKAIRAACAAGEALDAALRTSARTLNAIAHDQHVLAFDQMGQAARFLAERALASSREPIAWEPVPGTDVIRHGVAQLLAGTRTRVVHARSRDLERLRAQTTELAA